MSEAEPKLRAEDFLPYPGPLREQIEMQVGILTMAVQQSWIYSSGMLDSAEEPNVLARGAKPYQRRTRVIELALAAQMAQASAQLVSAFVRLNDQTQPKYGHRHTVRTVEDGKTTRTIKNTTISQILPGQDFAGGAPDPVRENAKRKNGENEGSNG